MNENEKIALGAVIAVVVVQAIRFRAFKKKVTGFVGAVGVWAEATLQQEIDKEFISIVENLDEM